MISHHFGGQTTKMSFWNKVSLVLSIIISLALFSFFTFTIFILALILGIVIFALGFFRRRSPSKIFSQGSNRTSFSSQNYQRKNIKDDNIIDI